MLDTTPAAEGRPDPDALAASLELPLDRGAAHQARAALAQILESWHLTDEAARYDVMLVTSELVTNAVVHGADRLTLRVSLDGNTVLVAVEDGRAVLPERPLHAADDATQERGRGLAIIAAVTDDWGIEELPEGGKRVWARLSF